MRVLLAFILLLVSVTATAETYRVWQYTDDVYVVLTETACAKPKTGLQVKAIREDGKVIKGCYVPDVKNMIRITWDNNDFAVLELRSFVPMSATMFNMMNREMK
jgi:hypothetical protein